MFGELLSKVVKTVTLPIDAINIGVDHILGGDGSKTSRQDNETPFETIGNIRDSFCKNIKDLDK